MKIEVAAKQSFAAKLIKPRLECREYISSPYKSEWEHLTSWYFCFILN